MRVLDVGCHDGFLGRWIMDQVPEVELYGMELHPDACRIARERGYAEVVQANAEQAPDHFPEYSFDAVVAYEIIEHVPDPEAFLDALERMLKPGGRIYCSTPNGTFGEGNNPHHLRALSSRQLTEMLRRRGTLADAEVGVDTITSAAYTPQPRLGEVAIYTGPGWSPWSPLDIETKGLGGSETAAVRLSEELAELGYVVTVYGEVEQCTYRDVVFLHHSAYDPMDRRDAVISSRIPELFDRPQNSRVRMLWMHDTDAGDRMTKRRAEPIDHVLTLSGWHRKNVEGIYPFLRGKVRQTRNGIHLPYFTQPLEDETRAQRLVYTSSPDRGLDLLLEMWPQIKAEAPDAVLSYCYSDVYDAIAAQDPTIGAFRDKVADLADQPGVQPLGALSQPDVARLMRTSRVWAAPSYNTVHDQPFHETSCLTADTLIDMPRDYRKHPDGVPIGDLVGESGFPVYAWDESAQRFVLDTANRVWKARDSAETIEIETEEGTTLTCTPDHKVLTFDGDWVEAGTLKPGDRLRGLNYRFQVNVNCGDGRWTGEHRMVGEWMEGRPLASDEHVHHLHETRLDNRPESLAVMSAAEHHSLTHSGREYSRQWREERARSANSWKETPEGREHYRRNAQTAGQSLWAWLRERVSQMTPDDREARSREMAERGKKGSETWWARFRALPEDEQREWLATRAAKIAKAKREKREAVANHRVKAIRPGPTVDVYDMEVAEHHNFVAGGVVVHNCIGAMEAQAAGCLVVASEWGALPETVRVGRLIGSEAPSDAWREAFTAAIVEGLTDSDVQAWAADRGPKQAPQWTWAGVAEQIGGLIEGEAPAFSAHYPLIKA